MSLGTLAWLVGVHDELVAGWVYQGGYTVVGRWEGYTGVLPSHRARVPLTAERAPEAPARGLEWVVSGSRPQCSVGGSQDHPCGARSVPLVPPCPGTLGTRLWANKARLRSIFRKVSQNGEVSSEYV